MREDVLLFVTTYLLHYIMNDHRRATYSSTPMLAAYFMLTIITIDSILIVLHSSVFLV